MTDDLLHQAGLSDAERLLSSLADRLDGGMLTTRTASLALDHALETGLSADDVVVPLARWALSSPERLAVAARSFDEKEHYLRIFLGRAGDVDLRLHVWLPTLGPDAYVENVHSHRRFLISRLLAGSYVVYDYEVVDGTPELTASRVVTAGTTYVIAPTTVHAITNPFPQHAVSLIVRGAALAPLTTYDVPGNRSTRHDGLRPVGGLGRPAGTEHLAPAEYLGDRFRALLAEVSGAAAALPGVLEYVGTP